MKRVFKIYFLGIVAFSIASCASLKSDTNTEEQRPSGQQGAPPSFSRLLTEMDTNKDGKLEKSEVKGRLANDFSKIDSDGDGYITQTEFEQAPKPQRGGEQRR